MSTTNTNPASTASVSIQKQSVVSIEPWKYYKIPDIKPYRGTEENTRKKMLDLLTAATIPVSGDDAWEPVEDEWMKNGCLTYSTESPEKYIPEEDAKFSYFQTTIDVSKGGSPPAFFVQLSQVYAAARIWLFNDKYKEGKTFTDFDAVENLDADKLPLCDIKNDLVTGKNRLVIVHVNFYRTKGNFNVILKLDESGESLNPKPVEKHVLKTKFSLNVSERSGYRHYDTSDSATKQALLDQISKIKNKGFIPTAVGTPGKNVTIKAGFVFCDFKDVKGDKIDDDYNKLIGSKNELIDFVDKESNGRVKLELEVYSINNKKAWVRLSSKEEAAKIEKELKELEGKKSPDLSKEQLEALEKKIKEKQIQQQQQLEEGTNYAYFKGNFEKIISEVDDKIEFPDDWKVVFLGFPNKFEAEENVFKETSGDIFVASQCKNARWVDGSKQQVSVILMDPNVYREPQPVRTTIHELGHALGLPDLYSSELWRSYGWSMMCDCRTGWNLTGFEKLVLGWDSLDDYVFLKSGWLETKLKAPGEEEGKKGVIILPEDNPSKKCYFIEVGRDLGRKDEDRTSFIEDDSGLLVMVVDLSLSKGAISPFVNKRENEEENYRYGGASKAQFFLDEEFASNGISATAYVTYGLRKGLYCNIGVDKEYRFPNKTTQLRENEFISSNGQEFGLTMDGQLCFGSLPCMINDVAVIQKKDLQNKGYGFCAFVDRNGIFQVAAAVDEQKTTNIIRSFSPPKGIILNKDTDYFFQIESLKNKTVINIYEGKLDDSNPELKYQLFEQLIGQVAGWPIEEKDYSLQLQNDGNLVLSKSGVWKWGSKNMGITKDKNLRGILLNDQGEMKWITDDGVIKKFSGGDGVGAPFSLALNTSGPIILLEVRDQSNKPKYSVSLNETLDVKEHLSNVQ